MSSLPAPIDFFVVKEKTIELLRIFLYPSSSTLCSESQCDFKIKLPGQSAMLLTLETNNAFVARSVNEKSRALFLH